MTFYVVYGNIDTSIRSSKDKDKLSQGMIFSNSDPKKVSLVPKGMEVGERLMVVGDKNTFYFEKISPRQYRLTSDNFPDVDVVWRFNLSKVAFNKINKDVKTLNLDEFHKYDDLIDQVRVYEGDLVELSYEGNKTKHGYLFREETGVFHRVVTEKEDTEQAIFVYCIDHIPAGLTKYKLGEVVALKDLGKASIPAGYEKGKFVLAENGKTSVWLLKTARSLVVAKNPLQEYNAPVIWVNQLTRVKYEKLEQNDNYEEKDIPKSIYLSPVVQDGDFIQVELKGARDKFQLFTLTPKGLERNERFTNFVPLDEAVEKATPVRPAKKTPAKKTPAKKPVGTAKPVGKAATAKATKPVKKEVVKKAIIQVFLEEQPELYDEYKKADILNRDEVMKAVNNRDQEVRQLRAGDILLFVFDAAYDDDVVAFEVKRSTLERLEHLGLHED